MDTASSSRGGEPASAAALTVPPVDPESLGFWEGTGSGELRMQACSACGRLRFPPQVMCPTCHHTGRAWRRVSGRGTIWSFVVPHPPLLEAYRELAPYNVIVVALEEDPALRLVGNLVSGPGGAINEIDPGSIVIGEAVTVVFTHRGGTGEDGVWMPEWVRAS
jgi:uncharacterized protein